MLLQIGPAQSDDLPGSSLRRPLHVNLQGGLPMTPARATGPLQVGEGCGSC